MLHQLVLVQTLRLCCLATRGRSCDTRKAITPLTRTSREKVQASDLAAARSVVTVVTSNWSASALEEAAASCPFSNEIWGVWFIGGSNYRDPVIL